MPKMKRLSVMLVLAAFSAMGAEQSGFKFTFGTNQPQSGWTQVSATNLYSSGLGHGFESPAGLGVGKDFSSGEQPFSFSVKLPEGNYSVRVALWGAAKSEVTIKAEARRLMLERAMVAPREIITRVFTVNVRRPELSAGDRVRLKKRELETEMITWDDKLTLEFCGDNPSIRSLEIVPTNVPTIFLCGDSTVCDQPREPWNSWGQMLPRFFGPAVAVAN